MRLRLRFPHSGPTEMGIIMRLRVALALAGSLLAMGCSGEDSGSDTEPNIVANPNPTTGAEDSTSPASGSESSSATPPEETAPAPKLGDTVQVDGRKEAYKVSALELDDVDSGNQFEKPGKGNGYFGVLAQWCLDRNDRRADLTISPFPWSLRFPDGTIVEPTFLSEPSVTPTYPVDQVIPVGTCGKGWIIFEGPAKQKPNLLVYAPSGEKAVVFSL